MKKQLIAIGFVSFLAVPSVVFAEGDSCAPIMSEGMTEEAVMAAKSAAMNTSECMGQRLGSIEEFSHGHGVSLYGSFRTGLTISDGDNDVTNLGSRWGFQGSAEVSEGLTAAFRYETAIDTATATSGGAKGRLSYVDLSGGFGAIRLGQIWSASANHYYFKIDPSHVNGKGGGSSFRNPNSISYSTSAGDVSFQIDKVTGEETERVEFGATAALGPVGVGIGHWKSGVENDESSFTGIALSTGAAGVSLTVGLGSSDDKNGMDEDISILHLAGSVGDSGITYGVQITNSDGDAGAGDQNLVALTSSLGSGASLIFEFADPGDDESTTVIGLRVDF